MNKQEVIEKIEKEKSNLNAWEDLTRNRALDDALAIVRKLEEPEKPVVPQFVADMIVKRKRAGQSVVKAIENLRFYEDACKWVRNNGETFVKAWLYGYEIEKEKLYTAVPNFITNSASKHDSYLNKSKSRGTFFFNDLDNVDGKYQTHFTQEELEKLNIWNNLAFEVEEVEE